MSKNEFKKRINKAMQRVPGTRTVYRLPKRLRRKSREFLLKLSIQHKIRRFKSTSPPRIIYALTPPPWFSNLGDHAQIFAIEQWLNEYFADFQVFDFDRDELKAGLNLLVMHANKEDYIFLHSGGSMGDRGRWSESLRRSIVSSFPDNRIVSLPQTIYFSDTERGRYELALSQKVYAKHQELTIIARDEKSLELAQTYFPQVKTDLCPDFVLYCDQPQQANTRRTGCILCLREDSESTLTIKDHQKLEGQVKQAGYFPAFMNLKIQHPIPKKMKGKYFFDFIRSFSQSELVVTDRFHGMIFSVITQTPCVVLPTEDHKILAGIRWFEDLPFVQLARSIGEVPNVMHSVLNYKTDRTVDWRRKYFIPLAERIHNSL